MAPEFFPPASCFHPKGPGQAFATYILHKSQCVYKVISSFSKSLMHMVKTSNRLKGFYLRTAVLCSIPPLPHPISFIPLSHMIYTTLFLMAWHAGSWIPFLPGLGIEPMPPTVEVQSPNHWTAREVSTSMFLNQWFSNIIFPQNHLPSLLKQISGPRLQGFRFRKFGVGMVLKNPHF